MEIGPIFRALFHNKSRFWLIAVEIALTLAIVVNCIAMIMDQRARMTRPTGMDVDHILIVESQPFSPEFEDDDFVEASYNEDLRMIRALPGVRSAASMHAIPLSGGGSASGRKASGSEIDTIGTPYYVVSTDVIETLGVELVAGRVFEDSDIVTDEEQEEQGEQEGRNVILTQNLADLLYPDGDALGKTITDKDEETVDTVIGIVKQMHCSWPNSSMAERVMLYPGKPAGGRRARYVVRAEPGMVDSLYTTLETELLVLNEGRILEIETMAELKADMYSDFVALNKLFGGVSVLLVIVTSLGIVGLTSFSVTQRTRQIGTRRALGATRVAILRYFLVENWIITSVGLTLGLAMSYGLNFMLSNLADVPRVGWPLVASGMVALWIIGLLAAFIPAVRGTMVQPVLATRTI